MSTLHRILVELTKTIVKEFYPILKAKKRKTNADPDIFSRTKLIAQSVFRNCKKLRKVNFFGEKRVLVKFSNVKDAYRYFFETVQIVFWKSPTFFIIHFILTFLVFII